MPLTHITDFLHHHAKQSPNKLALVAADEQLTWSELASRVQHAASVLSPKLSAFKQQQVVAILIPNNPQFVVSYLAVLELGHIVLPLDASYKELELNAVTQQIPPFLVISNRMYANKLEDFKGEILLIEDILSSQPEHKTADKLRLDADKQIASLVFTSGTTGKPKAAPYTHANHIWNIRVCSEVWRWNSEDTLLISLLFSHWYGLVMGLTGAIYHGNTLYLQEWFNATETLEMLSSGDISLFTHISGTYNRLLEVAEGKDYDLSMVRLCISGASALPPVVWQAFKDRFGLEILECYGSSESGRIASNLLDERIPGSPGRPLPDVETKINDDSELLVRSPGIFPGYWQNPETTKAALEDSGWWHTGDIAEVINGRIILKGRIQERIRRHGHSISPRDVEWALYQNPAIKDAYVMGLQKPAEPDDELVYFIVGNISEDELRHYCKDNMPSAWRPDRTVFLDKLPRTTNGKPQLSKLNQAAEA